MLNWLCSESAGGDNYNNNDECRLLKVGYTDPLALVSHFADLGVAMFSRLEFIK